MAPRSERQPVQLARSKDAMAMMVGSRTVEVVVVNGATVTVAYDPHASADAPLNLWATAVLRRDVRGDVVALIVKP